MNEIKQLKCKVNFDTNIEKLNPLFSKIKVRIAYTGENRNNSYISKESFEKALPTIYNCPIIGEFVETIDDFGSHGGKIEISDQGIKYIHTTKPYGVINENSEITWEDIVEEDGTVNTYLCATGYLWTGRYDELSSVLTNSKNQSMEIEISNGKFDKINNKEIYVIDDFIFSAFCILGDTTEPCFESASVTSYNFNKDDFKVQFSEMLSELKQFTKSQNNIDPLNSKEMEQSVFNIDSTDKGGKQKLDEKKEIISKYGLTLEQLDFSIEEISLEDLEVKLKEFTAKPEENFSLSNSQLMVEMQKVLQSMVTVRENYWGELVEVKLYYLLDLKDSYAIVANYDWDTYFGIPYTVNGDTVTLDFEAKVEFVPDWRPKENGVDSSLFTNIKEIITTEFSNVKESTNTQINKLQSDLYTITTEYEKVKPEYERLQEFESTALATERKEAEDALFEEFKDLDGNEEYEELKKKTSDYELEILSDKCFTIRGKKNSKFSIKSGTKKVKIEFSKKENEPEGEFDNLFEKYLK